MSEPPRAPTAIAVAVVVAIGGLALVLAGSHVTPSGYVSAPIRRHYVIDDRPGPTRTLGSLAHGNAASGAGSIGYGLALIAAALGAMIIAGLLVMIVRLARRHRWGRHETAPAPVESVPDVSAQVADAVEESLDRLDDDWRPVRDRIVACWLALQLMAERVGIARVPSDTPTESIARVLALGAVTAEPLDILAALYREARFSTHVMTGSDVAAARGALEAIRNELRTGVGYGR